MNVLLGCEESQEGAKAFREKGHEAYSCDLLPCSGGHPEWHLQMDIWQAMNLKKWDLIILFPECRKVCVSGNRYWAGTRERQNHIYWVKSLWIAAKQKAKVGCALENPVSVIWAAIGKPQYIQPWQFGHGETKKTGILTHKLPALVPTNIVNGREQRIWKMPPSDDRSKLRSKSYPGIMKAMAEQWG